MGKLLRGEGRLIPYAAIDEDLGKLLTEFGPRQSRSGTQFPFWRLRNDRVWEVSDADRIGQTSSGDALKGDLVRYGVSGGFPKAIAELLRNDPKLASDIIDSLLDAHFPTSIHDDILQAVGVEFSLRVFQARRDSPNFRASVLKAYEYKCAICGFDVKLGHNPIALEAAHIKWKAAGGPNEEVIGQRARFNRLSRMADAVPRQKNQFPAKAVVLSRDNFHRLARQRGISRGISRVVIHLAC